MTVKVRNKKFEVKGKDQPPRESSIKVLAVRKELTNSYRQADNYRKRVAELRASENTQSGLQLNEMEMKIKEADRQILLLQAEIESRKSINTNQTRGIQEG